MKLKERMFRIAALTVAAVSVVIFTVGSKDLLADDETPSEGATVVIQTDDEDASEINVTFSTLMGDKVEPRREFIEANAKYVQNLDI